MGTDNYLPPTGEAIREWRYRNERAQREYFKTVVAPNPADPAFLKIVEAISDAQKDAAVFRTSLPESLRKLRRVADDVEVWRSAVREESAAPALWSMKDGIRAVLDGPSVRGLGGGAGQPTPLGIGQATKVKARADTLVELAEAWLRQAEHVIRVAQWLILVRQAVPPNGPPEARAQIADASFYLAEAWARVSAATDKGTIENAVTKDVGKAFDLLTAAAAAGTPRSARQRQEDTHRRGVPEDS